MSPVPAPAKALVTGANGYVAAWVVRALLEQGYSVLGTVRSAAKGDHLKKLFAAHGDRFEIAVIEDMAQVRVLSRLAVASSADAMNICQPGAFDEVVKDVQLVEHTASPFHMNVKTPGDLINPAVCGTTGILESIRKFG